MGRYMPPRSNGQWGKLPADGLLIASGDPACGETVLGVLGALAGRYPAPPGCDPAKLSAARQRLAEWRAEDEARKAAAVAGLSTATLPARAPTPASALDYLASSAVAQKAAA